MLVRSTYIKRYYTMLHFDHIYPVRKHKIFFKSRLFGFLCSRAMANCTMRRNLLNWCNLVSISKKLMFYIYWLVKFIYSEKATKFCKISTLNLTTSSTQSNLRWRFHKILWPSQNFKQKAFWKLVTCVKVRLPIEKFPIFENWYFHESRTSGPSEGLKIRGCQYYLVGIICPPWLR